ncbi:5-hydroxytryptamine receptor 3A-like isoform X2 [Anguilla rostrata]|uniref:5-hydroxytryptamine receptor 3A-like isoform X2 n=1 Tax=Anguilla rostrata TaxID=7938 RepID=UPI0030CB555B
MKAIWLVCSLALAGEVSTQEDCSYQSVLDYLNLTRINEMFTATRPVTDWTHPTVVNLDVYLYVILAVIEKSQTFVPFVWVTMEWNNELISWNPEQFCGISKVSVPREMLWHPDLTIMECTEDTDKIFQKPYIQFTHRGSVSIEDGLRVISTCNMDVYKFPFDTQSCVITFLSMIYTDSEIQLLPASNSSWLTRGSQKYLQTQGEWDFLNISVAKGKVSFNGQRWDSLKYTITIKRRPMLIVMHFLLPLLFFLILDLSSFLISDTGGEKLGFKVTVLLAISVLLLILNDILPATAGRTPLIANYCIVTFACLLLSLLEAILVKHLIERDATAEDPPEGSHCKPEAENGNECSACSCMEDAAVVCERGRGSGGLRDSVSDAQLLQLASRKLQVLRRSCLTRMAGRGQPRLPYWEGVARRINTVYFCLYLLAVCSFLLFLVLEWTA